ncbi:hypothetical protein F4775DRAFT_568355 [Biscogniauxia sp. FL1348]|nr:hypothetical protein F4775DRAFT_568355 [Biscogniauxia sp. FL1348]
MAPSWLNRHSRRQISLMSYFAMWTLAFGELIVGLATERNIQLVVEPIILAVFTLFLLVLAALNFLYVESFDIVRVSGHIVMVIGTILWCRWYFDVTNAQIVIYLPTMVNLGILVAATASNFQRSPPPEQEILLDDVQGVHIHN